MNALLKQIEILEASDFPHADGELALHEIKKHFKGLLAELSGAERFSLKLIQDVCLKISLEVELHLPVLGFILRSTNVRNAFEVYDPLKAIVEKVIGDGAHLVVSSEWDFIPFTYPMTLDVVPNFVLVGGPAHESESALLIPLAGHEVGHSAWKAHDVGSKLDAHYTAKIQELVDQDIPLKEDLVEYYGEAFAGFLRDMSIKRLEELFCDAFGLYLFGDSYLYAFEHITYPGGLPRGSDYPKIEDRISFLLLSAKRRALNIDSDIAEDWRLSSDNPLADGDIDDLLDKAARHIYPDISDLAYQIIEDSQLPTPDEAKVSVAMEAFESGVPVAEEIALCDIICGGWRMIRGDDQSGNSDRAQLINELMLKSIEVSEFERRTRDAQRS